MKLNKMPFKMLFTLSMTMMVTYITCVDVLYPTSIGTRTLEGDFYEIEVEIPGEPDYSLISIYYTWPDEQRMTSKFLNFESLQQFCPLIFLEIDGTQYNAFPAIGVRNINQPETPNQDYLHQIRLASDTNPCNCKVNEMQRMNLGEDYQTRDDNINCTYLVSYEDIPEQSVAHGFLNGGVYNFKAVDFNAETIESVEELVESGRYIVMDREDFDEHFSVEFSPYEQDYVMTTIDRAPEGQVTVFRMDESGQIELTMTVNSEFLDPVEQGNRYKPVAWTFIGLSIALLALSILAIGVACHYSKK